MVPEGFSRGRFGLRGLLGGRMGWLAVGFASR